MIINKGVNSDLLKMQRKIELNWPIGKLLDEYPEAVEVFVKYGFHCFGCALAQYETIEQGAKAHGLNSKQLKKLLEELNSLRHEKPSKK